MKSYTDLNQSRKLAEILPVESADMCLNNQSRRLSPLMIPYCKFKEFFNMEETPGFLIPCWSLTALLDILPRYIEKDAHTTFLDIYKTYNIGWIVEYADNKIDFVEYAFDGQFLIDACYEMVLKLHDQKVI